MKYLKEMNLSISLTCVGFIGGALTLICSFLINNVHIVWKRGGYGADLPVGDLIFIAISFAGLPCGFTALLCSLVCKKLLKTKLPKTLLLGMSVVLVGLIIPLLFVYGVLPVLVDARERN